MCRTLTLILVAMLLLAPGFVRALTTPTAASAPATATAASAALDVTDTVAQIAASEDLQRAALARLKQTEQWRELAQRAAALQADFDRLDVDRVAEARFVELLGLDHRVWTLKATASVIVGQLASILRRLEHDRSSLETEVRMWQERRLFLRDRLVPAPVLERASAVEATLQGAGDQVREVRDSVLLDFGRALTLQARIDEASSRIAERLEQVRSQRMALETSSLWELSAAPSQFEIGSAELGTSGRVLREYFAANGARISGWFLGILVLSWWLFGRRSLQEAGPAQRAYGRPIAASLLIALDSLWWLAPPRRSPSTSCCSRWPRFPPQCWQGALSQRRSR